MIDRITNKFWRNVIIPNSKIKFQGKKFKIPFLQINSFSNSDYQSETWLVNLLKSINYNLKINTFLDVGVNIGQTLLKIKTINSHVQYIGFEPNPYCFSFIQQIISANNLTDCKIVPCGLSDKSQLSKLKLESNINLFDSSATLIEGFRSDISDEFQFVTVLTLDEIVDNLELKEIDLIKIDIEGAELEAICGMLNTIIKFRPIIIIEVLPSYDKSNTFRIGRQKKLAEIINGADYRIYHIRFNGKGNLFEEVIEFPIHKNVNESDYILLPKHIKLQDIGIDPNNSI